MTERDPPSARSSPARSQPVQLVVNGWNRSVVVDPNVPLLNVLRNDLELVGAKRGCAMEQCYACAVLIDGRTQPSCRIPVGQVGDLAVTTVEDGSLEPLRGSFLAEQAGQCGFCIAGMVVAAQGLLNQVRRPNDRQIREALDTNLCRCGVYDRVRRAIRYRIGEPEPRIWEVRRQEPLDATKEPSMDRSTAEPAVTSPTMPVSGSLRAFPELDSWIAVDDPEDGSSDKTITVFTGKAELGQGIATALVVIAADELSVAPGRIRIVGPDTSWSPDEGVTSGSMSIETSGAAIRAAAATARSIMLDRAADEFGLTDTSELSVEDGVINGPDGRDTSYWALQGGRPFESPVRPDAPGVDRPSRNLPQTPLEPVGHDDDRFEHLHRTARIDLPAKVGGGEAYLQDLHPRGTIYGRVVRPPGYESRLRSVDLASVEAMPGVVAVVRDGSFLGVVAEREEQAEDAARALVDLATWSTSPPLPDPHRQLLTGSSVDYFVVDGVPVDHRVESPIDGSDTSAIAARYSKPFILHGSLGPSSAMARYEGDGLTVWTHSQGVFMLRDALCEVLGMASERVDVIHREGAGCYGHNGADDVALDAALLARAAPGSPVLVSWTRADEHRWEPFGPAMIVDLKAELSGDRIVSLDSENWSYSHTTRPRATGDGTTNLLAGWYLERPLGRPSPKPNAGRHVGAHRNSDPIYAIERRRVQTHLVDGAGYRTSALRALGAYANVFALESFVDELADRAGVDPLRFRLANLADTRAMAVIEAVADAADRSMPRQPNSDPDLARGRGLAFAQYKNQQTYLAVIIDVSVDRSSGLVSIDGATIAADAGRIVSHDGLSNQLEGGCVQAASWTLKESVRLSSDGLESEDWETYPILRFSESFPVRTVLLDRPDQPSVGCGEAAQGPTAAAIANAVHDAIGVRLRDLPLSPARVLAVLAAERNEEEPATPAQSATRHRTR